MRSVFWLVLAHRIGVAVVYAHKLLCLAETTVGGLFYTLVVLLCVYLLGTHLRLLVSLELGLI